MDVIGAVVVCAIALLIIGIERKHPLALWVGQVLVMGAVFGIVKELFGIKGRLYGSTGRPRLRR